MCGVSEVSVCRVGVSACMNRYYKLYPDERLQKADQAALCMLGISNTATKVN